MLQIKAFNFGEPVTKLLPEHWWLCRTVVQVGRLLQANCDIWLLYLKWNLHNSAVKVSLKALVHELKYARHEKSSTGPWELRQDHTWKNRKWKSLTGFSMWDVQKEMQNWETTGSNSCSLVSKQWKKKIL